MKLAMPIVSDAVRSSSEKDAARVARSRRAVRSAREYGANAHHEKG
jgi:hypothetical protein